MIARGRGRPRRLWAGIMVGEGGSWLGNGYLSFQFLSKFQEKWEPKLVDSVSLKSFVCKTVLGKGLKTLAAMCQL